MQVFRKFFIDLILRLLSIVNPSAERVNLGEGGELKLENG